MLRPGGCRLRGQGAMVNHLLNGVFNKGECLLARLLTYIEGDDMHSGAYKRCCDSSAQKAQANHSDRIDFHSSHPLNHSAAFDKRFRGPDYDHTDPVPNSVAKDAPRNLLSVRG
jgi:hypothetical protein